MIALKPSCFSSFACLCVLCLVEAKTIVCFLSLADPVNLTKFYSINVTGTNEIVPKQHQMTIRNTNTTGVPASSNRSYLFQPTPLINQLSFPTSSSGSSNSGSSGGDRHHSTSPSTSSFASSSGRHHHGGHAARGGFVGYAGNVGHPYVNCRIFIQSQILHRNLLT